MSEVDRPQPRPQIDGYPALDIAPPVRGRTARVYKAVRATYGGFFALSVLSASVEQSEFLEEAFLRETRSLAELRHPNIVRMHSSGITTDGER
jgi:serine/threonine protein kinase